MTMETMRTPVLHTSLSRPAFLARAVVIGALTALGAAVLPACTSSPVAQVSQRGLPKATDVALVRYSSCGQALRNLRAAATAALGRDALGVGYAGSGVAASGPSARGVAGVPGASAPSAPGSAAAPAPAAPASGYYSGTNDAVAGVDEPDLIKTNGQRIVTVIGSVLRVVDARTHQLTGSLDLSTSAGQYDMSAANLLLSGDHALVLLNSYYPVMEPLVPPTEPIGPVGGETGPGIGATGHSPVPLVPRGTVSPLSPPLPAWGPIAGPRLLLVDISTGVPEVISEYTMDGWLVDARQVGSIARVIVRSAPRLFVEPMQPGYVMGGSAGAGVSGSSGAGPSTATADRAAIARASLGSWLPRYAVTDGGVRRTGLVSCGDVSHPAMASYSGSSMLTVLTFDLSASSLGDGQPVTIVADGGTVYSNGASLYVVNDQQWFMPPTGIAPGGPASVPPVTGTATPGTATPGTATVGTATVVPAQPTTAAPSTTVTPLPPPTERPVPLLPQQYISLYKFSIVGPGRPVYEASGTVPGWLLGSAGMTEYALSEWNGVLRVATTTEPAFTYYSPPVSYYSHWYSAVYELEQVGSQLVIVGKVGGMGAGEQIYAVRFAGPVGYVVTYRQVDPLYTLDLSDPAQPRVVGVLRLRGYSAYLDPIDATHLIGVGQDTNSFGEMLGTQVGLFDTSDLAAPVRLAVYHLWFGHSQAEFDPHAFLYWPLSRIVVIPVTLSYPLASPVVPGGVPSGQPASVGPTIAALVLGVGDHSLTKLGMIRQPAVSGWPGGGQIQRSLVIGNALWTLSDAGLQANDLTTLAPIAWVPFT
jgi:hypothetical protein